MADLTANQGDAMFGSGDVAARAYSRLLRVDLQGKEEYATVSGGTEGKRGISSRH